MNETVQQIFELIIWTGIHFSKNCLCMLRITYSIVIMKKFVAIIFENNMKIKLQTPKELKQHFTVSFILKN